MSTTRSNPDTQAPGDRPEIDLGGGGSRRWLVLAVVGVVLVGVVVALVLRGGGDSEKAVAGSHFSDDFAIAYQASSASEQAFLEYLDKEIAPDYGVRIDPVGIEDGNQLDQATADGKYIANIYQHKHWLQQVTDSTGMKLTALGPVFQWSYSIYSSRFGSLEELPDGATIALLNDPANTAQALWILERAGVLTFKDGVDPWAATEEDIASNPRGFEFTYMEYGAGPRTLDSVDAVIDYNMSFVDAGTPDEQRIYAPDAPREFAGQLVVGTEYLDDPQVATLKKVFFDPRVQEYLATNDDPSLSGQLAPVSAS
ncbi:MetQ/NlpA family ABC transporter substrate-binding protein [Nocardioides nitrophenolicus]|uniref:MetQ/NlpA family ABC transporter substrate-binding protein n=1 Tax=Nocardioides nitrophenolicus TaxID=60489 RepID=UPI00195D8A48|nr:MetQ/NlpA family ABC transporter substrate-binding protein [Nocardioides nitrophenolicus]MBM7519909.1 ABC-type metal ion transport system substrate-binding protein [Nocardioides nitrophenolicus]